MGLNDKDLRKFFAQTLVNKAMLEEVCARMVADSEDSDNEMKSLTDNLKSKLNVNSRWIYNFVSDSALAMNLCSDAAALLKDSLENIETEKNEKQRISSNNSN